MPGWLWAVIAVVLGNLSYLSLRRRGGGGRRRGAPAIEYFADEHPSGEGHVDSEGHVELEGHVDREGHVELEGQVAREGRGDEVPDAPLEEMPEEPPEDPPVRALNVTESRPQAARTEREPGYGLGSAVPNPTGVGPQGWTVKGNADSMLFYTADAPSYLRSAADVWFESEEAATAAGFTRWNAHHR
jgi:hypothetical protein